jgi:hypothetical protein
MQRLAGGVAVFDLSPDISGPLARTARRSLAFKASMAFVVYKIRRTSKCNA